MKTSGFSTARRFFIDSVQVNIWCCYCFTYFISFSFGTKHCLEFPDTFCKMQISPLKRPIKWENVATFSSPSSKSFSFVVEGGRTMELAIAQFWSSGAGSHEATIVDFEVNYLSSA